MSFAERTRKPMVRTATVKKRRFKVTAEIETLNPSSTSTGDNAGIGQGGPASSGASLRDGVFAKASDEAGRLRDKATEAARGYAETGRDQTASILDHVAQLVQNAAGKVEGQVGDQYADYVRKAADSLTSASETLRSKEIDELLGDARDYIKSSPALAIGAAAAAGFLLARVIKAGQPDEKA